MFTRRFYILFACCIAMAALGAIWSSFFLAAKWAVAILVALCIIDLLYTAVVAFSLQSRREHNQHLSITQPNPITITAASRLSNPLLRPVKISICDYPPASFRSDKTQFDGLGTHTYNTTPLSRGKHIFGDIHAFVRTSFPGLCEAKRKMRTSTEAHVFPAFHNLEKLEILASERDHQHGPKRMRRAGNSTEFEQIRAYVPGDDIRSINWRATARATSLMVNTYTDERSKPIIPILCAGPAMNIATDGITLLDRATSAAIALGSSAIRHYDEAGLITVTHLGVDTYLKPERGTATVSKLLNHTYDFGLPPTEAEEKYTIDPDVLPNGISEEEYKKLLNRANACEADADLDALADFVTKRIKRRSLMVLFANFENLEVAKLSIPALQRIGKQHVLVVVLFRNEGIHQTVNSYKTQSRKKSNKLSEKRFRAICAHYLEQTDRLAAILKQNRINVISTTPQGLTAAVLSNYLQLKNRAII